MKRLLTSLFARLHRAGRPSAAGGRRASLHVEALEDRLALSSTAVGGVVLPDTPVYGYKHRKWRPYPYAVGASAGGTEAMPAPVVLDLPGYQPPPPVAVHLAAGGADGVQIVTTSTGPGIAPPQGPLAAKY
jgi:hypothetical protein